MGFFTKPNVPEKKVQFTELKKALSEINFMERINADSSMSGYNADNISAIKLKFEIAVRDTKLNPDCDLSLYTTDIKELFDIVLAQQTFEDGDLLYYYNALLSSIYMTNEDITDITDYVDFTEYLTEYKSSLQKRKDMANTQLKFLASSVDEKSQRKFLNDELNRFDMYIGFIDDFMAKAADSLAEQKAVTTEVEITEDAPAVQEDNDTAPADAPDADVSVDVEPKVPASAVNDVETTNEDVQEESIPAEPVDTESSEQDTVDDDIKDDEEHVEDVKIPELEPEPVVETLVETKAVEPEIKVEEPVKKPAIRFTVKKPAPVAEPETKSEPVAEIHAETVPVQESSIHNDTSSEFTDKIESVVSGITKLFAKKPAAKAATSETPVVNAIYTRGLMVYQATENGYSVSDYKPISFCDGLIMFIYKKNHYVGFESNMKKNHYVNDGEVFNVQNVNAEIYTCLTDFDNPDVLSMDKNNIRIAYQFIDFLYSRFMQNDSCKLTLNSYMTFKAAYNRLTLAVNKNETDKKDVWYAGLRIASDVQDVFTLYEDSTTDITEIANDIVYNHAQETVAHINSIIEHSVSSDDYKNMLQELVRKATGNLAATTTEEPVKVKESVITEPEPEVVPEVAAPKIATISQQPTSAFDDDSVIGNLMAANNIMTNMYVENNDNAMFNPNESPVYIVLMRQAGTVAEVAKYSVDNMEKAVEDYLVLKAPHKSIGVQHNNKSYYLIQWNPEFNRNEPAMTKQQKRLNRCDRGQLGQMVEYYEYALSHKIKEKVEGINYV